MSLSYLLQTRHLHFNKSHGAQILSLRLERSGQMLKSQTVQKFPRFALEVDRVACRNIVTY